MFDRRLFLAASAAAAAFPTGSHAELEGTFRPEDFGARGDGATNDAQAFAALSAAVNHRGGGTISLRSGATYVIGAQDRSGEFGWNPVPVLELKQLPRPIQIRGNGARILCAPDLRYGTFDIGTGARVDRPMPNFGAGEVATPYRAMIHITGCTAAVEVRDVELDGNLQRLRIGGQFGDTGWQIPAIGLFLEENEGPEAIVNVLSHDHAQDGAMIIGAAARAGRGRAKHLVCRHNGRQGLSLTAGQAYDFADCEFSQTGRARIYSAPGAGVDIEAERRPIRDVTFTRCKFVDNAGVGLVADSGDTEGAQFTDCLFVGTTNWSVWPYKPNFRFRGCTFVGAVLHAFADPDPAKATRFIECQFTDDPRHSPTGKVYIDGGPIVNLATSDNVFFDGCTFTLVDKGTLPWSWKATYRNCRMSQLSSEKGMPKGKYLGRSVINGNVDLYGAMVEGTLLVNGNIVPHGSQGGPPW